MSSLTQANRRLAIKTPLGEDVLFLQSMTMRDELGRPWSIDLDLRSDEEQIKFEDIVGHAATIRIDLPGDGKRYIHGYFSRFSQDGVPAAGSLNRYRATLVPWLWFLTRTSDCRIFQEKSAADIIKEVLAEAPGTDVRDALTYSYPKLEYCVQYRETDFNFVSRLMEENGIYYFFEHEDGRHTMVLADSPSAHEPIENYDKVPFMAHERDTDRERIMEWAIEKQLQPTKYAHAGFDFKAPRKSVKGNKQITRTHGANAFEVYDHPCYHAEPADATEYARVRAEELAARYEVATARTDARGLCVGAKFKLTNFPRQDQNRDYVIIGMTLHAANGDPTGQSGSGAQEDQFQAAFQAIEAATPFHSPRLTPKPLVNGPQTAIVTGPGGEEIYTDEHGRVKVHFHWHRYDESDQKSSCWIRVSHAWAGKQWGAIYLPRIGQEVIVSFLEGDPDRPIITGRVYNGDNMPPYGLPANKTVSTLQSRSSKDAAAANFNEIKFEDKKGSELLYIQAEKDRTVLVKNDNTETVGHDETIKVENDRKKHIVGNETTNVDKNRTETVKLDETITIEGNRTETVKKDEDITIGANRTEDVTKNEKVTIHGDRKVRIDKTDYLDVGKTLTIVAADQITIKTGSASIDMKKDGTITIKGKNVTVDGSGKIDVKASQNMTLKGQKILQN
jgi:type VI secretion system secreted protein VgrG